MGLSVAIDTQALADELVEEGVAANRSRAFDLMARAWRDRQANSDLLAAAAAMTESEETSVPGVVGGGGGGDDDSPGGGDDVVAVWPTLNT